MPQFAAGAADALLRLLRKVEVHQVNRGQIMERQNCNIKEIMESRRHAVDESLHTISVAELNALADELFPDFDHPFLEKFVGVINDPGSGPFYHARAGDGIQVLYCQNKDIGMWYTPSLGTGRLEPAQLKIMKEIVQARC
jgi:hypothetical protein